MQTKRGVWCAGTLIVGLSAAASWSLPAAANPDEPRFRVTREHPQEGSDDFRIVTVSAKNDLVSGGDVLVRIDVDERIPLASVNVQRNGLDVTAAFSPLPGRHSLLGLVTGLVVGDNLLAAARAGQGQRSKTQVRVTNHPISGPIISGPHEQPFFCTTSIFAVPSSEAPWGARSTRTAPSFPASTTSTNRPWRQTRSSR